MARTGWPQIHRRRARRLRWTGPSLLALLGVLLTAATWGRWPDAHIDFGLQLYQAWQLREGAVLYRDLASLYGPLSPYVNAAVFWIFGTGLRALVLSNLALLAAATALLYAILVRAFGRLAATAGGVVFLTVFAFGHGLPVGNYNFVCPYLHELTHGAILSLLALWALLRWERCGRARHLVLCGLAVGLVVLTKPETTLAALAGAGPLLAAILWRRRRIHALRTLAIVLGSAALPLAISAALFARALPPGEALWATFGAFRQVANPALTGLPFFRHVLGLDEVATGLSLFAKVTLGVGLALGLALAAAWASDFRSKDGPLRRTLAFLLAMACALVVQDAVGTNLAWSFAPLLAVLLAMDARQFLRDPRGPLAARAGLGLLALSLLAKMALYPRLSHYGFVLAMPAGVSLCARLVSRLPSFAARFRIRPALATSAALGLVASMVVVQGVKSAEGYARQTEPVGRGADRFLADWRGPLIGKVVAQLSQLSQPDQTVAALPDAVMLNYLARRRAPTRFTTLAVPEFHAWGEEAVVAAFRARPPDFVVLLHRDFELPPRLFGRDYAGGIAQLLRDEYRPVARFGDPPGEPGSELGAAILVHARASTAH